MKNQPHCLTHLSSSASIPDHCSARLLMHHGSSEFIPVCCSAQFLLPSHPEFLLTEGWTWRKWLKAMCGNAHEQGDPPLPWDQHSAVTQKIMTEAHPQQQATKKMAFQEDGMDSNQIPIYTNQRLNTWLLGTDKTCFLGILLS